MKQYHKKIILLTILITFISWCVNNFSNVFSVKGILFGSKAAVSLLKPVSVISNTGGKTNILFLGLSDPEKKGSELTDTIIVTSLDLNTGKSLMVSLPRDIWIPDYKTKLNSIYSMGGKELIKKFTYDITGISPHYIVTVDFSGFIKAIDAIGGLSISVDRTFDDYKYPIPGKENAIPEQDRYEHIHFDAGVQTMDGERALKFVRSRHAVGDEGTDFARNARQQKVLMALKEKLLDPQILLDPEMLNKLVTSLKSSITTDYPLELVPVLGKVLLKAVNETPKNISIREFLKDPPPRQYLGQFVLIPISGNWEEVKTSIQSNGL